MQVIIPVAGKGTRLLPHTEHTPKALMDVAGKSMLQHILDRLVGLPITNLILVTGHLSEKFNDFKAPFPVTIVHQSEQLGTAHVIGLTREHVKEPILIIFSDTVFDADLSVINRLDADGIIWAKEVEDYQRFGVIVHKDNVMEKIVEKPTEPISKLANIGLYYIRDYKTLFEGIDYLFEHKVIKKGEYFLTDAFQYMVDHGKKIIVEPVAGWYDCGTWEIMIDTNKQLLAKQSKHKEFAGSTIIAPVWIADDARITGSVVGPNVSVAEGVRIENSVISESIISREAHIQNAVLSDSIIGPHAKVEGTRKKLSVGSHSNTSV